MAELRTIASLPKRFIDLTKKPKHYDAFEEIKGNVAKIWDKK